MECGAQHHGHTDWGEHPGSQCPRAGSVLGQNGSQPGLHFAIRWGALKKKY